MSGSFQEAREGLRDLRKKLGVVEEIMGSLEIAANSARTRGFVPELAYDRAAGELVLRVNVGDVPPRVQVTIGGQPLGAFMAPEPKPSLGDLSDAAQGLVEPKRPLPVETIKLPPAFPPAAPAAPEAKVSADAMPADTSDGACTQRAPAPQRPRHKTGEWTPEEERRLLDLHDAGRMIPDMVAELDRKGPGIAAKLRYLLAKRIPSAAPDMGNPISKPAPVASPPPRPAAPPSAAGPILPPGAGTSRLEREAEARLAEVQDPEWPPARDRDLLERMMRGDGAGGTAEAMGIGKHDVLSRWRSLFPNPPTIDEQAAMLAAVRRRQGF